MNLGIHIASYIDKFSDDPTNNFEYIKNCGIDVVEISILQDYSLERALKISDEATKVGLKVICCTAIGDDSSFFDGNEALKIANSYLKNCIDFTYNVKSNNLSGVLYAPWKSFDDSKTKEEKYELLKDNLTLAIDYAKERKVNLNFEVLNRFESDVINTLDEGAKLIKILEKDNCFFLADTFHMNIEEQDPLSSIKTNIKNIGSIHITENNRNFPQRSNKFWKKLINELKEIGYDKNVIFECCCKNNTEVSKAFSQRQDLTFGQDINSIIKASALFIKDLMK